MSNADHLTKSLKRFDPSPILAALPSKAMREMFCAETQSIHGQAVAEDIGEDKVFYSYMMTVLLEVKHQHGLKSEPLEAISEAALRISALDTTKEVENPAQSAAQSEMSALKTEPAPEQKNKLSTDMWLDPEGSFEPYPSKSGVEPSLAQKEQTHIQKVGADRVDQKPKASTRDTSPVSDGEVKKHFWLEADSNDDAVVVSFRDQAPAKPSLQAPLSIQLTRTDKLHGAPDFFSRLLPGPDQGVKEAALVHWISGQPWNDQAIALEIKEEGLVDDLMSAESILRENRSIVGEHHFKKWTSSSGPDQSLVRSIYAQVDPSDEGNLHADFSQALRRLEPCLRGLRENLSFEVNGSLNFGMEASRTARALHSVLSSWTTEADPDHNSKHGQNPLGSLNPNLPIDAADGVARFLSLRFISGVSLDDAAITSLIEYRFCQMAQHLSKEDMSTAWIGFEDEFLQNPLQDIRVFVESRSDKPYGELPHLKEGASMIPDSWH